ncbi:MAG: redoxin domain-containing protein [Pirellulales bacterium]|nr:redoxin domain-containing protein [Pirellulales bacterium]
MRGHVVDVHREYPRLKQAGGELLLVTMGTPQQAAMFRDKFQFEATFLADAQRQAYRAFGLERGTMGQVLGPRVWLGLLKGMARGGVGKPIGDVRQMPGAFVVDRQGIVRYTHYPSHQAEAPSYQEIVALLESLD